MNGCWSGDISMVHALIFFQVSTVKNICRSLWHCSAQTPSCQFRSTCEWIKNCHEQVEGMRAFQTVKVNAGKDGQWSAPQRQSLHDILLTLSEQNACPFTPSQASPTFNSAVWASAAAFMQSAAWTRFASEAWSHHRSGCVICLSLVLQISRFQGSQTSRMMSDDAHKNASCAYPYFRAGPSRSSASIGSRIQTHGSTERYLLGQLRHISMAWSDCGSIPHPAQVQPRFVCRCK